MKLWGGRFKDGLDQNAWDLNTSIGFDQRMASQDVRASMAWCRGLAKANVISQVESQQIIGGLEKIEQEFSDGQFVYVPMDEDIHTAVERRLHELIGSTAGKLHTGRSRNDQVATDFRLWMLENLPDMIESIQELQVVLIQKAEEDLGTIMPGYTHLQRAQPILVSHWWLSHFWPLSRDVERFQELLKRVAVLPLGSAAFAGTTFEIDRQAIADELGFNSICENSMDGVTDRDFAVEFLFAGSLLSVHLSKLAEQMIIFSSMEFKFFTLDDRFTTGSSLMPQKKNPDIFELTRGKSGTILGKLTGLLTTLKGLPSTYDKDMQEDKPPVFDVFDILSLLVPVLGGALRTTVANADKMRAAIDANMMATDLADYLVEKGMPFRQAHELVGEVVLLGQQEDTPIDQLTLSQYQTISNSITEDVFEWLTPEFSINRRVAVGGTSEKSVKEQIQKTKDSLK